MTLQQNKNQQGSTAQHRRTLSNERRIDYRSRRTWRKFWAGLRCNKRVTDLLQILQELLWWRKKIFRLVWEMLTGGKIDVFRRPICLISNCIERSVRKSMSCKCYVSLLNMYNQCDLTCATLMTLKKHKKTVHIAAFLSSSSDLRRVSWGILLIVTSVIIQVQLWWFKRSTRKLYT